MQTCRAAFIVNWLNQLSQLAIHRKAEASNSPYFSRKLIWMKFFISLCILYKRFFGIVSLVYCLYSFTSVKFSPFFVWINVFFGLRLAFNGMATKSSPFPGSFKIWQAILNNTVARQNGEGFHSACEMVFMHVVFFNRWLLDDKIKSG